MDDTTLNPADIDSLRRELYVCSLGFVVAIAVPWQIMCVCVSTGGAIQLYSCETHTCKTYIHYCTLLYMVCSIKTSFYLSF